MILGAIIAGGQSSRFGSDKADALLKGETLLAHTVAASNRLCDATVIVGRHTALAPGIEDRPRPAMGPLGGIAAALDHAVRHGYESVLTIGVDCVGLPDDLIDRLNPAPAFVADIPVIGLWPAESHNVLDAILSTDGNHSVRAFAEKIGARGIDLPSRPANINTVADLQGLEKTYGL